jgi:hypothetical protein
MQSLDNHTASDIVVYEAYQLTHYFVTEIFVCSIPSAPSRCAHSFSGSAAGAALLHVDYNTLPPVNTPPTCAVTSPADGVVFIGTTDVTVTAVATDAVGAVANVEFLLNDLVVGQDVAAPYSFTIPGLETGSYRLAVRAIDDSGAITTSVPLLITIKDQNLLPTCNITSPAVNTVFTAPANINIDASAVDGDGSIAKVEFFSTGNKIGEDFSSPFSFVWTNVPAGSYSLTAIATDNDGGIVTSAAVAVSVNPSPVNSAPTIAAAGSATPSLVTGTTATLSVLGADDNGEANLTYTWATTGTPPAAVTFSVNGTNAAKTTTVTFARAGSYTLVATIRDQGNLTVTSTVAVTVNQTLTSIVVSPTSASIATSATQQFTATARDQFATNLTAQPTFTWSVSGGGTISSTGLFIAGTIAGGPYTVTASSGGQNATASVTVMAVITPTYRINCGSSNAVSPFTADQYGNGGTQHTITNTIAITGITNPAPQTVYQSERYGTCTYTLPNLTANAQYTVRLHFAELYQTATGKRVFNVGINGTTVLSNFDIYAVAGGQYKAFVREFTATANTSGQIVINFTTVKDNATIGGIEIIAATPNAKPTIATAAAAAPNLVTGTTAALSVLGADDNGESALTYTWATTGTPPAAVTFSANGTNAAKAATATFTKAGTYAFQVTVKDAGNQTAISTVSVTVDQTLASIIMSPTSATIAPSATQQFTATARDQFTMNMTTQPTFTWSVSGGGTVSPGGLFTAGAIAGGPYTITAVSGDRNVTASVTVAVVITPTYRINCGSSSAVSPFTADQYSSGGTQRTVTNTITITGITNPAPQSVYQSERYGTCTYTLPGLTSNAQYTVRLHFVELYQTATGKRVFNVRINGTTVLSSFDIYAVAGAQYKAVVREFTTTANASGQVVINLTTVTDNATISGIEAIRN